MTDTKQDQQTNKQQEDFGTALGGGIIMLAAGYGLYKILTRDTRDEARNTSEDRKDSDLLYRLIRESLL